MADFSLWATRLLKSPIFSVDFILLSVFLLSGDEGFCLFICWFGCLIYHVVDINVLDFFPSEGIINEEPRLNVLKAMGKGYRKH